MRLVINNNAENVGKWAAIYIAKKINNFVPTEEKKHIVLGLPTGSTPLATYKELINLHKAGLVSFKNVVSFNMDEYVGLDRNHEQSYYTFMHENFFNHIDIDKANTNILDGMATDLEAECERFEEKIKSYGGIDLFMGGVGEDGHIAFNEPGSSLVSRTRIKTLTEETRIVNSRFFDGDVNQVPKLSLTVGVGTIMDAKEVMILITGAKKARALKHGVEGYVNHFWTITALQQHRKGIIVCDDDATLELKVGTVKYYKDIEKENVDNVKNLDELKALVK